MPTSSAPNQPKSRYLKPEIKEVSLRPEEAVLGGCKTTVAGGPIQATCVLGPCSAPGS
jgi:hypothetical protein